MKTFKDLGSLLINQNYIQEEMKFRLKAGNSCYYSVRISKNLNIKIYKTIILPVVLYDCEALSLALREMGMGSGNFIIYTVHLIVRVIKSSRLRLAIHVVRMEEGRTPFKNVTGTPTGRRALRRPRRRGEDNIRMHHKEISINARIWVDSAQDRVYRRVLVNAALNLRVP